MRISDWSSDVCSSDLACARRARSHARRAARNALAHVALHRDFLGLLVAQLLLGPFGRWLAGAGAEAGEQPAQQARLLGRRRFHADHALRSEEHTSELQSLMRISYAVFCLNKKNHKYQSHTCELH